MEKMVEREVARQCVGRKLFGADWIGSISPSDRRVLSSHVRRVTMPGGREWEVVEPLPKNLARRVDRALGRSRRMMAQIHRVIDWMEQHHIDWTVREVEVARLAAAIERADEQSDIPRTGPRDDKFRAACRAMQSDLDGGRFSATSFAQLKLKEIAALYGVKKNLADKLKKHFAEIAEKGK